MSKTLREIYFEDLLQEAKHVRVLPYTKLDGTAKTKLTWTFKDTKREGIDRQTAYYAGETDFKQLQKNPDAVVVLTDFEDGTAPRWIVRTDFMPEAEEGEPAPTSWSWADYLGSDLEEQPEEQPEEGNDEQEGEGK